MCNVLEGRSNQEKIIGKSRKFNIDNSSNGSEIKDSFMDILKKVIPKFGKMIQSVIHAGSPMVKYLCARDLSIREDRLRFNKQLLD